MLSRRPRAAARCWLRWHRRRGLLSDGRERRRLRLQAYEPPERLLRTDQPGQSTFRSEAADPVLLEIPTQCRAVDADGRRDPSQQAPALRSHVTALRRE